ncbi:MAG TPA: LacI family DNA-binding transcriptional regulator [Rectinemataceae bacterium]|nr:LacI family DNA-binding transcriptional regulator [Rectinemataceae bacterium]
MISIKDLARLAGVSPSTISRAVNGKKYVKPEIRERVLALVKETGYVPNSAARSMVLQRTFTVGIVIPDTFNMFQRQLFSTIERSLEVFGYRTLFYFVKWEAESELKCLRRLKAEKLDGIIMLHEVTHPSFYEYLADGAPPVVLCTFSREGLTFHSVHVDEVAAAKAATSHLIGLGHRDIGLISGIQFSFGAQRAEGYREALRAAEIGYDESRTVFVPSYTLEDGRLGMMRLLERKAGLTALFAATDELAIGAVRALHEAGLRVPDDVSVVGFDDIDITEYLAPALTTIRQPIQEMGGKTAAIMSELIAGEKENEGSTVLGFELVVRESSARLRGLKRRR